MIIKEKMEDIITKETGIDVLSVEPRDGHVFVEMEFYSPLGEEFLISFDFDGSWSGFCDSFYEEWQSFDPDEHAEMWIPGRGKRGVPNSVLAIAQDAVDIDNRLEQIAEGLDWNKYDEDWMPWSGESKG